MRRTQRREDGYRIFQVARIDNRLGHLGQGRGDTSRRRPSENTLCGMRLPQKRTAHVDVLRCAMVPKLANKPRCGACEERLEAMRALEALS